MVGDPVQTSWPDPEEASRARDEALRPAGAHRRFRLRTNYRNSAEIFAVAADAVRDLVPAEDLPVAVRSTGVPPRTLTTAPDELAARARAVALELAAGTDGTVGVITTMDRRSEVREWLAEADPERIRVVGSLEAKGMEYDGVVVVDPAGLAAESSTGRRTLYVALSRATQQLTVLEVG